MTKTYALLSLTILIIVSLVYSSCSSDEDCCGPSEADTAGFDRRAMLVQWADDIIIPSFESYTASLERLKSIQTSFSEDPSLSNLATLRSQYIESYTEWQRVSLFDIGEAESIGLRNFSNIYPTNEDKIIENLMEGNYNLELPSNFVAQGFPALDFLLFGLGDDDATVSILATDQYDQYLNDLVSRLLNLSAQVWDDWRDSYRNTFVNNDASSATASVDKLVNDVLFYYEKFLRAGKIGIPAGVFSGDPISSAVEAPYSGIYSKLLFTEGLETVQAFFNADNSIKSYLDFLEAGKDGSALSELINNQLASAKSQSSQLQDNLKEQVESENDEMLKTYDELQKAVVLLKVDMLQALNIKVDFVDADGD